MLHVHHCEDYEVSSVRCILTFFFAPFFVPGQFFSSHTYILDCPTPFVCFHFVCCCQHVFVFLHFDILILIHAKTYFSVLSTVFSFVSYVTFDIRLQLKKDSFVFFQKSPCRSRCPHALSSHRVILFSLQSEQEFLSFCVCIWCSLEFDTTPSTVYSSRNRTRCRIAPPLSRIWFSTSHFIFYRTQNLCDVRLPIPLLLWRSQPAVVRFREVVNSQFLSSLQFFHFMKTSNLSIAKCFFFHDQFFLWSKLLTSRFCISEMDVLKFQSLSISLLLKITNASAKKLNFIFLLYEFRSRFGKQMISITINKRFRNIPG